MHTLYTTAELLHEDGERVIATHEVRISFGHERYVPATYWQPAEGGTVEYLGAEVQGNNGGWIKLRRGDPLDTWCEAYFEANENEFQQEVADAARDAADDRGDREYDRMRDEYEFDQLRDESMMGLWP